MMENNTEPTLNKIYLNDKLALTCIEQGAKEIQNDSEGHYIIGFTHGVVAIDLYNNDNCATTIYWKEGDKFTGVQAYFNQFKKT